jgi:hypothetical protein
MREKLIKLLINSPGLEVLFGGEEEFAKNADWLIANDVVPVVRCKECKYCDTENGHCDHPMGTTLPLPRKQNDICSYGERREQ